MSEHHFEVLLVEDDPGDVVMTQEAFVDGGLNGTLHVTRDGIEAMEFLRNAEEPRPDLVLLDLNLPRMAGHEVLAAIRADDALTQLPVVVLTTSSAQDDVERSYRLHANAYVTKPTDALALAEAVRAIDELFTTVARRPPEHAGG